jgi:hypothetical protein
MQHPIVFMPSPWGLGGGDLFPHYLWDFYGENAKQKLSKAGMLWYRSTSIALLSRGPVRHTTPGSWFSQET